MMAHGGDVLHNQFHGTPLCNIQKLDHLSLGAHGIESILCEDRWIRLTAQHVSTARLFDELFAVTPGTRGDFTQIRNALQLFHLAAEGFTAAVIGQTETLQPA